MELPWDRAPRPLSRAPRKRAAQVQARRPPHPGGSASGVRYSSSLKPRHAMMAVLAAVMAATPMSLFFSATRSVSLPACMRADARCSNRGCGRPVTVATGACGPEQRLRVVAVTASALTPTGTALRCRQCDTSGHPGGILRCPADMKSALPPHACCMKHPASRSFAMNSAQSWRRRPRMQLAGFHATGNARR